MENNEKEVEEIKTAGSQLKVDEAADKTLKAEKNKKASKKKKTSKEQQSAASEQVDNEKQMTDFQTADAGSKQAARSTETSLKAASASKPALLGEGSPPSISLNLVQTEELNENGPFTGDESVIISQDWITKRAYLRNIGSWIGDNYGSGDDTVRSAIEALFIDYLSPITITVNSKNPSHWTRGVLTMPCDVYVTGSATIHIHEGGDFAKTDDNKVTSSLLEKGIYLEAGTQITLNGNSNNTYRFYPMATNNYNPDQLVLNKQSLSPLELQNELYKLAVSGVIDGSCTYGLYGTSGIGSGKYNPSKHTYINESTQYTIFKYHVAFIPLNWYGETPYIALCSGSRKNLFIPSNTSRKINGKYISKAYVLWDEKGKPVNNRYRLVVMHF